MSNLFVASKRDKMLRIGLLRAFLSIAQTPILMRGVCGTSLAGVTGLGVDETGVPVVLRLVIDDSDEVEAVGAIAPFEGACEAMMAISVYNYFSIPQLVIRSTLLSVW